MKINYPPEVTEIARILAAKGHKAYAVGGCVRDSLMGRVPSDWDMTTDATPDEMLEIFGAAELHTIPTGLKHGTVTVMIDKKPYECTTFRIDGSYTDSRRPDKVEFSTDISEDLCRRDFTVNAMAADPLFSGKISTFDSVGCEKNTVCDSATDEDREKDAVYDGAAGEDREKDAVCDSATDEDREKDAVCSGTAGDNYEIIDLYGGIDDIKHRVIRCVGDAKRRFAEDALRILRAIRFATVLDFEIESETLDAAVALSGKLSEISAERKTAELEKILLSEHADRGVRLLIDTGIAKYIHPEIAAPRVKLCKLPRLFSVRLSALLMRRGRPSVASMKLSNEIKDAVCLLADDTVFDECRAFFGDDVCANARMTIAKYGRFAAFAALLRREDSFAEIIQNEEERGRAVKISDLNVNGNELMNVGIEQKRLGEIFSRLLVSVIKDPSLNEKQRLIALAKELEEHDLPECNKERKRT